MSLWSWMEATSNRPIRRIGPISIRANPFVASFIGTPPMNLWQGRLRQEGGTGIFRVGGLEWPYHPLRWATWFVRRPRGARNQA